MSWSQSREGVEFSASVDSNGRFSSAWQSERPASGSRANLIERHTAEWDTHRLLHFGLSSNATTPTASGREAIARSFMIGSSSWEEAVVPNGRYRDDAVCNRLTRFSATSGVTVFGFGSFRRSFGISSSKSTPPCDRGSQYRVAGQRTLSHQTMSPTQAALNRPYRGLRRKRNAFGRQRAVIRLV